MVSAEGESFELRTPVPCEGPVETWMSAVEAEMRRTLAAVTKEGVFYYAQTPRSRWISESLGMVTLAGSQVRHCMPVSLACVPRTEACKVVGPIMVPKNASCTIPQTPAANTGAGALLSFTTSSCVFVCCC
jgi:hypothetical protein